MSEYWVSQEKHWCQYCRIYIANNKPSRNIHEQGKKHKENVERFLRNIYRKEQEERKEDEKIKRELKRIERDALKQYKKDLALEVPGANIASIPPPPPLPPIASYTTPSVHQPASQPTATVESVPADTAAPTEESVIGEWRPVTPPPMPVSTQKQDPFIKDEFKDESKNDSSAPPPPQDDDDDFEDPDDLSNFRVVEKTLSIDEVAAKDGTEDENKVVSFKKRKFGGGSNKSRNIRKRTE